MLVADITKERFKNHGFYVTKVVVPGFVDFSFVGSTNPTLRRVVDFSNIYGKPTNFEPFPY